MTDKDVTFALIFITLIILLLIAGIVISVFMYRRQDLKQSIRLKQLELEFEKELRQGEAAVAASVSNHISRELHDNIGQLLTVLNLQIETHKHDKPPTETHLNDIQETVKMAHQEVRSLTRTLNTDYIERNGIVHSIQLEIERLKRLGKFDITWEYDEEIPTLTKDQQLMAFRIFQEIINNALKHSKAQRLAIQLIGKEGFRLHVTDNGIGFNPHDKLLRASANGLENIKRRAELANLRYSIDTAPGKGCAHTLSLMNT